MIHTVFRAAAMLLVAIPLLASQAAAQDGTTTGSVIPVTPETRVYPAQPGAGVEPLPLDPSLNSDPGLASDQPGAFSRRELLNAGHQFFGDVSQGLAGVVEHSIGRFGLPNGYIVGQEGSGAFIGGARYGEGILYTKNAGQHRVYWQGPSIGLDVGANGDRVMMLIYELPSLDALFRRYVGVNGSAYVVAGLGMTVLSRNGIYVVPIVSGLGARLGVNFGYLKFTRQPTWNPF